MHLSANRVYAQPREDDYPNFVGFHDSSADWSLVLSRFSDLEPDAGAIEIVVRDQICASTANLIVDLTRSQCRVRLDEMTATRLLGIREYTIDFQADDGTYELMVDLLRTIFDSLPGLTIAV